MKRSILVLLILLFALIACRQQPRAVVVLIGGEGRAGAPQHDHAAGIRALQALLEADDAIADRIEVRAFPDGWPADPAALTDAATIIWYFEGGEKHPLRDPVKRAAFETAIQRGAGVVALHQASTVPVGDDFGLRGVLGAVRVGLRDRTTQWTQVESMRSALPLLQRVPVAFGYRDEFYPTFERGEGEGIYTPLLRATLNPQFRDGVWLVEDRPETRDVGWAFESANGARAVTFSGMHYAAAFDQPELRTFLRNAVLWTARVPVLERTVPAAVARSTPAEAQRTPATSASGQQRGHSGFHAGPARDGWFRNVVTPSASDLENQFGEVWQSPRFADHGVHPPRLYASPLFLADVALDGGQHRGRRFDAVLAATSNGDVYLVNTTRREDVAAGRILWHRKLGAPCALQPAPLDGVATGILSTPVIDRARGVAYVTHCDPKQRWQAYALRLGDGAIVDGWPVRLDEARMNAVNTNAGPRRVPPRRKFDYRVQRAALALSSDGNALHVGFGESETGWLAAVDTRAKTLASAFSTQAMPHRGAGGVWGSGGPAVDADGTLFVATGTGYGGYTDARHDWTQSVLALRFEGGGYRLVGTYTPFNHCLTAKNDIDLGSGGVALLPAARDGRRLLAVGGKQGNVYLLDRTKLPGGLERRPSCDTPSSADGSLLPPGVQPQFGARGPLSVFGPYSEEDGAMDIARSRTVPAAFVDADGRARLFVTGGTRPGIGQARSIPPSLVRLDVATDAGAPYLRIAARELRTALRNPGSPMVTGRARPLVWVLDENAPRSALLAGDAPPRPVLYVFDGDTLRRLWSSAEGVLQTSGKYNAPAFGAGLVFVGSDRIQAFGAGGRNVPVEPTAPVATTSSPPASGTSPASAPPRDAGTLYAQRCAICHDNPSGNIPPRALVATRPKARIVAALTTGIMRTQANGLTPKEIDGLADYLRAPPR